MKATWKPNARFPESGRLILPGKGFQIEFFPEVSGPIWLGATGDGCLTGEVASIKRPSMETWVSKSCGHYVLRGDFRKQYEDLIDKGFVACVQFYLDNWDEHKSDWSTFLGCEKETMPDILAWHSMTLNSWIRNEVYHRCRRYYSNVWYPLKWKVADYLGIELEED